MKTQGNKFISPGAWFSLYYPLGWTEFEDMEGSFLFYNPDTWNGNFRISAFKAQKGKPGADSYGTDSVTEELGQNKAAEKVTIGEWECAYYKETIVEEGNYYTTHIWITGKKNMAFECSFTVPKGGDKIPAELIISTLELREEETKYPVEYIPIRVLEIGMVNESFEWTSATVKKMWKKDFTSSEEDIAKIQQVIDNGGFKPQQKEVWYSLGIAFGTILSNEIDGMEWITVIDGAEEYPALRYRQSDVLVCPSKLVWEKIKKGLQCHMEQEFEIVKKKVEEII